MEKVMFQEAAFSKPIVAEAGIKRTLCLLPILFNLLPSVTKIFLTWSASSTEDEKV